MKAIKNIMFIVFVFNNINLFAQAPVPIQTFDGTVYSEFIYAGPNDNEVDYKSELNYNDTRFIKEGDASRMLKWNFKKGQYFGWGVNLSGGGKGFDASGIKFLTFWVIGINGNETFQIKIKDMKGVEHQVQSRKYLKVSTEWQEIKVPLSDFPSGVDFTRIENINLGFNEIASGSSGTIYIDNFQLIY